MFSVLGIKPEYTLEQLFEIEELFFQFYHGKKETLATTIVPFGFYLGQTMIKNIAGAAWHNLEAKNLFDLQIKTIAKDGGAYYSKPFMRFVNYIHNEEDKPSTLLWTFKSLSENTYKELMEKGEPMTDGWYKFPEGHMIRIVVSDKKSAEMFDGKKA